MRSKQLQPTRPRTWVLVFDTGDDPVPELERFAQQQGARSRGDPAQLVRVHDPESGLALIDLRRAK
jgi:hypothetical protein